MKTRKYLIYPLIDQLICLVLTLHVSTVTTKIIFCYEDCENKLRNKMEDEFLVDCLVTYIERKIAEKFNTDFIIDELYNMKECRARLR